MATQTLDPFNAEETQSRNVSYFAQSNGSSERWRKEVVGRDDFRTSSRRVSTGTLSVGSTRSLELAGLPSSLHPQYQTSSQMGAEEETVFTADPIVNILTAFHSLPIDCHADLFNDFQDAAQSHDLRRLLDTISDWAATAEIYSHSSLAADLQEAIGGRKGVADWLHG